MEKEQEGAKLVRLVQKSFLFSQALAQIGKGVLQQYRRSEAQKQKTQK